MDNEASGSNPEARKCRLSELVRFRVAAGGLVCLTPGINGRSDASALIGDQILAALDEFFPLGSSAIDVLANLLFAAVDKSVYLLLTPVHDGANVLRSFTRACTQILCALACSRSDVFTRLFATLRRIKDAYQSADAQSG